MLKDRKLTWVSLRLSLIGDLELKGEQKAVLNAVDSNTTASPSNNVPTGFVAHFVAKRCLETVWNIAVSPLYIR